MNALLDLVDMIATEAAQMDATEPPLKPAPAADEHGWTRGYASLGGPEPLPYMRRVEFTKTHGVVVECTVCKPDAVGIWFVGTLRIVDQALGVGDCIYRLEDEPPIEDLINWLAGAARELGDGNPRLAPSDDPTRCGCVSCAGNGE